MKSGFEILMALLHEIKGGDVDVSLTSDLDFDSFEFLRMQFWLEECVDVDHRKFISAFNPGALRTISNLLDFIEFVRR